MKKVITTTILLLLLFSLKGQNTRTTNHEIGINITDVIEILLPGNGELGNQVNQYFLLYKYNLKKFSIRARVGGNISNFSKEVEDINISTSNRMSELRDLRIAIGLEKSTKFKTKWSCNYGFETLIGYKYQLSTNIGIQGENPEVVNQSFRYGLNLLLGIKYNIKPWLSIGSESSLQFIKEVSSREFNFDSENNSRPKEKSNRLDMDFLPTNGFFVIVHF